MYFYKFSKSNSVQTKLEWGLIETFSVNAKFEIKNKEFYFIFNNYNGKTILILPDNELKPSFIMLNAKYSPYIKIYGSKDICMSYEVLSLIEKIEDIQPINPKLYDFLKGQIAKENE